MSIFTPPPELNETHRARLAHILGNYGRLNEVLVLEEIELEDLQRLVLMELEAGKRLPLLRRLVGEITTKERFRVWTYILVQVEQAKIGEGR